MEREMEALIDDLCASVVQLCRNQVRHGDLDSREIAIEHRENRVKEEQELLLREKACVQSELSERDTAVQQLRQEINKLTLEHQAGIAAKDEELQEVKQALDSAKTQCARFAKQLEQLNKTMKEAADSHVRMVVSYKEELQCQTRLAQCYKEAADKAECKVEELTSSLESLQQLYDDAKKHNTILELADLPDNVLLKIFEYLPFEDCVRAGRVSHRFRAMAEIILSKTNDLYLTDPKFERLTPLGLSSLVDICKNNLEEVTLSENPQLAATFSEFSCPRLVFLDMGEVECGADVFGALMKNNQNVEHLIWETDKPLMNYPPGVVSENLLKLELRQCDDAALAALSGRCPNLQVLRVCNLLVNGEVLDQFVTSSSRLETVCFVESDHVQFDSLINFWRLSSLRNLEFGTAFDSVSTNDKFLVKISESFLQLQSLTLSTMDVTNTGINALTALPNLCRLKLRCHRENEVDTSVEKFANWGKLEQLILRGNMLLMATLMKLIRFCPKMYYVSLKKVADTDATDALIEQFRQLCSSPGQDTRVVMSNNGLPRADYTRICDVLDEIANAGGRKIVFVVSRRENAKAHISPCP